MLPPAVVLLFLPDQTDMAWFLSVAIFIASQIFMWRLTNVAIGRGATTASAVYAGMFAASVAILLVLQWLLGLT